MFTLTNSTTNSTAKPSIETAADADPGIAADLDDFLADPIGYGSYDWSDPIVLDQFDDGRCQWFRRATVLAR